MVDEATPSNTPPLANNFHRDAPATTSPTTCLPPAAPAMPLLPRRTAVWSRPPPLGTLTKVVVDKGVAGTRYRFAIDGTLIATVTPPHPATMLYHCTTSPFAPSTAGVNSPPATRWQTLLCPPSRLAVSSHLFSPLSSCSRLGRKWHVACLRERLHPNIYNVGKYFVIKTVN